MIQTTSSNITDPAAKTSRSGGPGWLGLVVLGLILLTLMAAQYFLYPLSTMPATGFRYLLFPPLIAVLFLAAGARFTQHVYGLVNLSSGFRYMLAKVFSLDQAGMAISEGKVQVNVLGEENVVHAVGGPGYLTIMSGSAALIESLDDGVRVVGPGPHYLRAGESVKTALSLGDRSDRVEEVTAVTRDGFPVTVRGTSFRYRLATGLDPVERVSSTPYSFSDEALIRATYGIAVGQAGLSELDWPNSVRGAVQGAIADFIRTSFIDMLSAPDPAVEDPRSQVQRQLTGEAGKKRFRSLGAELLFVDIGHFEMPVEVGRQRVDLWQVSKAGDARLMRARGEARRAAYQEIGRAEGQAEMLINIANTLEAVDNQGNAGQSRSTLYLAGMAQVLDSLSQSGHLPSGEIIT